MKNKKGFSAMFTAIILFTLFVLFLFLMISTDNKIEKEKENFCEKYNLTYRSIGRGFFQGEPKQECFGERGTWELERNTKGYLLIGYKENEK